MSKQIGQRTDILVHASGGPNDSFWMRGNMSVICSRTDTPNMQAAIYYENADVFKDPSSQAWPFVDLARCNNVSTLLYFYEKLTKLRFRTL